MSNSALPYYQRTFFKNAEDLRKKDPQYNFDQHCFYMLNVCELCGQPLDGKELPATSGKKKFSIMTDTTEYMRHESRKCDKHQCKRFIVGTYAQYGYSLKACTNPLSS